MKPYVIPFATLSLSLLSACGGGGGDGENGNARAQLNSVGHWNHVSVDSSGFDHSSSGGKEQLGPTKSSRAMAIVHIAIHDAIQSIEQRYQTFLPIERAPADASVDAAIAQSSFESLASLFPQQREKFEKELKHELDSIPEGVQKESGIAAGHKAAKNILDNRAADGYAFASEAGSYVPSAAAGHWRPDPVNPQQKPLGPQWSQLKPFVIESATQFRAPPPPAITSAAYAEAYAEVYRLGGDGIGTPTERSEDQTEAGLFWAYDGTPSLCAPPRLYNQIVMQLAADHGMTDRGDLARLLALVNISMADAAIASWESKFHYDLWRPITAIREADKGTGPTGAGDGNDLTTGDPTWTPLGAPASNLSNNNFTPPFPAYVSGHATFGGALFETLRRYFGVDAIPFTFVSDELNGVTIDNKGKTRKLAPRSFASLSEAEEENGQSRIYLGIHWQFDKVEGTKMGNHVADYVFDRVLQAK